MAHVGVEYSGKIKAFFEKKGWGFIDCLELKKIYGKDVLFTKEQWAGGFHEDGVNDPIAKDLYVAFTITVTNRTPEAMCVRITDEPLHVSLPGIPGSSSSKVLQHTPVTGYIGEFFIGHIKSWNPNSGWGHIMCLESQQVYGKDIFYMKNQLPGGDYDKTGTRVRFGVVNSAKGPVATDITLATENQQATGMEQQYPSAATMLQGYSNLMPALPSPISAQHFQQPPLAHAAYGNPAYGTTAQDQYSQALQAQAYAQLAAQGTQFNPVSQFAPQPQGKGFDARASPYAQPGAPNVGFY